MSNEVEELAKNLNIFLKSFCITIVILTILSAIASMWFRWDINRMKKEEQQRKYLQ